MRCGLCGSKNVHFVSQSSYDMKKGVAGAVILGPVGAIAGVNGNQSQTYHCMACGQDCLKTLDPYFENQIDEALANGDRETLNRLRSSWPNIEYPASYSSHINPSNNNPMYVTKRVEINPNATTESLLQRIEGFVEDGDWENALNYCEFLLDKEPTNPEVYKYKLLIENQSKNMAHLAVKLNAEHGSLKGPSYNKLLKYGGKDGRKWVDEVENLRREFLQRRAEADKKEKYNKLVATVSLNSSVEELKAAADEFKKMIPYEDAEKYYNDCINLIPQREEADRRLYENAQKAKAAKEKEKEYKTWVEIVDAPDSTVADLSKAIAGLKTMGDYKECSAYIKKARKDIVAKQKNNKKQVITAVVVAAVLVSIVAGYLITVKVIVPGSEYKNADALYQSGNYEEAAQIYESLGSYKDSANKYNQTKAIIDKGIFDGAVQKFESGDYETALIDFMNVEDAIPEAKEYISYIQISDNLAAVNDEKAEINMGELLDNIHELEESGMFDCSGFYNDKNLKTVLSLNGTWRCSDNNHCITFKNGYFNEIDATADEVGEMYDGKTVNQVRGTFDVYPESIIANQGNLYVTYESKVSFDPYRLINFNASNEITIRDRKYYKF